MPTALALYTTDSKLKLMLASHAVRNIVSLHKLSHIFVNGLAMLMTMMLYLSLI